MDWRRRNEKWNSLAGRRWCCPWMWRTPTRWRQLPIAPSAHWARLTCGSTTRWRRKRDRGTIIQVGSALAYRSIPLQAAYCAAKHAVKGFIDLYLGRTGYDGQQTAEHEKPTRPDNLWNPIPGDAGAHGVFDDRSYTQSNQVWLSRHVLRLALVLLVLAAALWFLARNLAA